MQKIKTNKEKSKRSEEMKTYRINNIIEKGKKFYNRTKNEENCRYRSWEYCYKIFNEKHNENKDIDEKTLDYLCLNLAFYLASWGMYRGSSFLLKKDYRIHKEAIKEIFKKKYNSLWNLDVKDYLNNKEIKELLNELISKLKEIYEEIRKNAKEDKVKNKISSTLITKILMGTFGCVPAYDRFFIKGIKSYKIKPSLFGINSITSLAEFYNENYKDFEEARKEMKIDNMEYPQMKVIDMCFWQIGLEIDANEKA